MLLRSLGLVCLLVLLPSVAAAQETRGQLPCRVDLEPEYRRLGLISRVQGERGTCSLFAITAVAEFEYNRGNRNAPLRMSEEFLIWAANEATGHRGDGALFAEAVHGLNALGICRAELAPYRKSGATRPSDQAIADAKALRDRWKVNWIRRWSLDRPLSESQFWALKAALAKGHPIAVGLRWPKKQPRGALLEVPEAGDVFDGHSIAFTGYEDDATKKGGGVFLFRNSFGPGWGRNGYGVMSYAYAETYVNDALWLECGAPGSEIPTERFEAEGLTVVSEERCPVVRQEMSDWGGRMWSGQKQLFCRAREGARVEFEFRVSKTGRRRMRLLATAAPDYGTIRVSVDGKNFETDFDLYAGRVCPSGSLELGERRLTAGKHTLSVWVVGKNTERGELLLRSGCTGSDRVWSHGGRVLSRLSPPL